MPSFGFFLLSLETKMKRQTFRNKIFEIENPLPRNILKFLKRKNSLTVSLKTKRVNQSIKG